MRVLSEDEALTHRGSLLSTDGKIVASYDLEQQDRVTGLYHSLADAPGIRNAAMTPFQQDYRDVPVVHVINGMGVALGDSVMGLTAIEALRRQNPDLRCVMYRPGRAPAHTDGLYQLAAGVVADMRWLPWPLSGLPVSECAIDLGNQLFWPEFATLPMIDFFLWALGVDPASVPADAKRNYWLKRLCLPDLATDLPSGGYVLFCSTASTPIRSIPAELRREFVDRLWQAFGLPVVGFEPIDHPHYVDVRALSPDTGSFIAWVKGARFLLSADTAAVHIAAGFDVPTTAFFTTIRPELRVRDYPLCRPVALDLPGLDGVHASSREQDLSMLRDAYRSVAASDLLFAIED
ncbi:TPA: glycosyltransferase family 9 protein [Burkholderia cepacia]